MATEGKEKKIGPWGKFMHWYESYQGKNIVNIVYSVGASVVIIGALFKILHWPGASQVLMIGMFTEAFLFIIGALDKPHPEFHWDNVFPQLLSYGANPALLEEKSHQPRPTLLGSGDGAAASAQAVGGSASAAVPSLGEKDMASLKDGIAGLAKTAQQLSELGKVATSVSQLDTKLTAAGAAADKFVASQDSLSSATAQLGATLSSASSSLGTAYGTLHTEAENTAASVKACQQSIDGIGTKLSALNAIYELQLTTLQAQVDAYKAQTELLSAVSGHVNAISQTAAEAEKSHSAYAAASATLAKQVSDLNKVYGNMLNALA